MANQTEEPQLSLGVEVKNPSWIKKFFSRSLYSFRYTSLFQVLSNPFLWCNVGIVVMSYLLVQEKSVIGNGAFGLYPQEQFLSLSVNSSVLVAMATALFVTFILSLIVNTFGKNSLVTYLNIALFVFLVYVVKVMITPLLLLQQ
jgi:hypothetical protein